ncbi:MAG: RNA methyltransferase [Bacteroidales bacterium]|nr:RNA methyltransferase [Bacteroidales bacterium]MDD3430423.1 RNA methyltransferase [Bacteroidales bacterium]MDD4361084.1 RNA methyltransferase [Bacteroidales bacterium]MDD4430119.1 RNA methyltransferase [Bacteroidales bacterium]
MERISSLQNPKIKQLLRLQTKARERKEQDLVLVEGAREIQLALSKGYRPEQLFICPELSAQNEYSGLIGEVSDEIKTELSLPVFQKLAYRESSDGLLATLRTKSHLLEELVLSKHPFVIVLEAVEKPGNLGAILRTADAAAVDAVIVCDPLCDLYNPNVVRSSIGCLFTVQTAVCSSQQALDWMKLHKIKILAAELKASQWYHNTDMRNNTAIVMGTEADGLSPFWLNNADERIKIPMRGYIDSLNVSVSTAVLSFEAMRQREFR